MNERVNLDVAAKLEEAAALLSEQGANPFRVRAYRQAASTLSRLQEPVSSIITAQGVEGLEKLPGIGESLARAVRDIVRLGYFPMVERLRGDADPIRLLASVPGIGLRLATRLHDELGVETLEDLEAAAYDGRLEDIAGFGVKRLCGVRDVLAQRLARVRRPPPPQPREQPAVAELLDIDQEYRDAGTAGRLPKITPRRFNPDRRQWLPILHTTRHDHHYTALYSNTARAHRLRKTNDWVVIYCDRGTSDGQWTVVTATGGPLIGRRVVRGREDECARHYGLAAA
ncbi:MAG: DNA-binding protein [Acidobacteria bacterium]|nr:MAG: DNA-binding protein [Acidobacteriota bacterium]